MAYETHTRTGAGVLVDQVRENAVDEYLLRRRRKVLWLLLALAVILTAWCLWRRDRGPQDGRNGAERPAYGAILPAEAGAAGGIGDSGGQLWT
ncbi:MAG TPA: hypothetical protein VEG34_16205 [Thermoanaerobaculia bacterium]|nr:hypothetical protein [Thermoanaerobaculia bacterium]